jgi:hypothetical protein
MMMVNTISCHFEIVIRNSHAHQTELWIEKALGIAEEVPQIVEKDAPEAAAVPASRAACAP